MSSSEGGAPRVTDNLSAPLNPSSTPATDNMSAPQKSSTLVDTPATESLSDTADLIARTRVATTRRELPLEKLPLLQRRNRRVNPNVKRVAEKHEDDRGGKRHGSDDKDTADLTARTRLTTIRRALPLEELPLLQRRNHPANPNVKRVAEKHEDDQGGKRHELDHVERDFFASDRATVPMLTAQWGPSTFGRRLGPLPPIPQLPPGLSPGSTMLPLLPPPGVSPRSVTTPLQPPPGPLTHLQPSPGPSTPLLPGATGNAPSVASRWVNPPQIRWQGRNEVSDSRKGAGLGGSNQGGSGRG